ncbi:MAG: serine--tRNA ligase [Spirochaetaceae bacterium]|nr:MAG: serine--tRNA ligase [Spirochaetaceae bacterium]
MLDPKFIRDNAEAVQANIRQRNMQADAQAVVRLYDQRSSAIQELESLRARRNENAQKMKAKLEPGAREQLIQEGKELKAQIPDLEQRLKQIEEELTREAERIPNMMHPEAPIGSGDESNREIKRVGRVPQFGFPARDHVELGSALDLIDFETATRVSGTKFYYLKNEAVILELALCRFAIETLQKKGFVAMITPDIAREEVVAGIGYNPRGPETNIYSLQEDNGCLVGTAEITLGGYHGGQILEAEALPIKLAGISHCFRKEAGAAGQFSKGLYRVHQFTKVEMFVYCLPQQSDALLEELREIEEQIFSALEIPFRVVDTCSGDLGAPAYRKYDLEAWMPGRGESGDWGEITSTSNCTDYQARRLGVRYRDGNSRRFVHMLNGTAIAISRALIALLENFQQSDGSVRIPAALVPYTGFDRIGPREP